MSDEDFDFEDEDFDDLDEEEEEKAKPKAKAKKPVGIGARVVAEKLGADPKTFRAWLRRKVEAGEFEGLQAREARARYTWANWKDPELVEIMKAWKEDDHTRGGGRKKASEETEEAPKKKAPAKRKPAARKRTAKK